MRNTCIALPSRRRTVVHLPCSLGRDVLDSGRIGSCVVRKAPRRTGVVHASAVRVGHRVSPCRAAPRVRDDAVAPGIRADRGGRG
jgi:hypothetical protein